MPKRTPYRIGEYELLLTDRDIRILEALEQFRLLDTRLIQRLQFAVGTESGQHRTALSATRVATRVLGRLEGHGFLARVGRRVGGNGHGSGQTVWQLASAGERLLRARRGETGRRRYVDPGTGFLDHTLEVARTAATLIEGSRTGRFDVLQAYLTLPDVNAMQDNVMEGFHEIFAGTCADNEAALRALSPLSEWESSLAEWCVDHGIEFDALEWNLEPLISRLAEVYDLIELKGRIHAFIR